MKLFSLLAVLFVGFSLQANANLGDTEKAIEVESAFKFSYNSTQSYYRCSYAEGQLSKTLRALGASAENVNCRGGIQDSGPHYPLSLEAAVTSLAPSKDKNAVDATWQKVVLKGRNSCKFNLDLINAALKSVHHKMVSVSSSCFDSQGSYKVVVEVLK